MNQWSGVFSGLFSVILKRSFYYIKKFEIYFLLINFEHVLRLMLLFFKFPLDESTKIKFLDTEVLLLSVDINFRTFSTFNEIAISKISYK